MLSVLIPVYNFDVRDFVKTLYDQLQACAKPFEIVCYDDASDQKYRLLNQSISSLPGVIYKELAENIGRSCIRNLLAENSQYEYLLFLDCDSRVTSTQFIKTYLDNASPDAVLYGGRSYASEIPGEKDKYLRWYYGVHRESVSYEIRRQRPYKSFMTNNFMIPRAIFDSIKFNEMVKGYGHEDTLFGNMLRKHAIPLIHLDNPLCHLGLESSEEFLLKTEQGLRNLLLFMKEGIVIQDVKIVNYYKLVKRFGVSAIIKWVFKFFRNSIRINLKSDHPSLLLFDYYKLGYMVAYERKEVR